MKNYLTFFLVVLAVLIAFKLAGAIVHYFFWPILIVMLAYVAFLMLRKKP